MTGTPRGRRRAARSLTVGLASAALVLVAPGAWAWWSSPSTGSGTRALGTSPVLGESSTSLGGALVPGSSADLTLTLSNPGAAPVTVTSVTGSVTSTTAGGCPTSSVTVGTATPSGLVVPANGSTTTTLTGLVTMATSAASACQGVGVTLALSVAGRL